ncbi:MAG: 30S ribosomal protein S15 [Clostridiales bacterium]|nr:30S ribosomal protein S15 [Clostridiales bacterium]
MDKISIINQFKTSENDTGSVEVQVALLTSRINHLNAHLAQNPNDNHSRRGLLKMVGRRKGLLDYLKSVDINKYRDLISRLGLRK